jgi:hypothetical protein
MGLIDYEKLDLTNKFALAEAYRESGSQYKLTEALNRAGRLNQAGRPFTRTGVKDMLQKMGIKPDQPVVQEPEIYKELLDYLKSMPSPLGRPPVGVTFGGKKYAKELIGCDLHAPLHHDGAWELFLAVAEYLKPEGITLNGDTLDLAQLSKFVKTPEVAWRQVKADMIWAQENVFNRINAVAPDAIKTWVMGNHEIERYESYLWSRCQEIADLDELRMEHLLKLEQNGWRYEPDGYDLIPEVLMVDHGDRHSNQRGGGSAMSARAEMMDTSMSGVSGHTHHLGKFWRLDRAGYRVWLEGGCLCDQFKMRKARVTARKRGKKLEDWHLGFAVVYYSLTGESFDIKDVAVLEHRGKTFCILNEEEISV